MFLIYETEEDGGDSSEAARGRIVGEYTQLIQRLKSHGTLVLPD